MFKAYVLNYYVDTQTHMSAESAGPATYEYTNSTQTHNPICESSRTSDRISPAKKKTKTHSLPKKNNIHRR